MGGVRIPLIVTEELGGKRREKIITASAGTNWVWLLLKGWAASSVQMEG